MLCEMTSRRRVIAGVAAAGLVPLLAPCASRAQQPYTEISYQSGGLRIQGYFYQPAALIADLGVGLLRARRARC